MDTLSIDLSLIGSHLLQMSIAFVLTLPIGWNREYSHSGNFGLRTFPLVAMASCGYILLGQVVLAGDLSGQGRMLQGLMTGIGFLGGGAIVKEGMNVHGTATAAAIWSTAAVGACTAYQRYEIAATLALVTFFVLFGLPPVEKKLRQGATEDEPQD